MFFKQRWIFWIWTSFFSPFLIKLLQNFVICLQVFRIEILNLHQIYEFQQKSDVILTSLVGSKTVRSGQGSLDFQSNSSVKKKLFDSSVSIAINAIYYIIVRHRDRGLLKQIRSSSIRNYFGPTLEAVSNGYSSMDRCMRWLLYSITITIDSRHKLMLDCC